MAILSIRCLYAVLFDEIAKISPALLAFLRFDTGTEAEVKNRFDYWHQQAAADGLDIVQTTIIRLAVDGLFYTELIDAAQIDDDLRTQVIARLLEMTEGN